QRVDDLARQPEQHVAQRLAEAIVAAAEVVHLAHELDGAEHGHEHREHRGDAAEHGKHDVSAQQRHAVATFSSIAPGASTPDWRINKSAAMPSAITWTHQSPKNSGDICRSTQMRAIDSMSM